MIILGEMEGIGQGTCVKTFAWREGRKFSQCSQYSDLVLRITDSELIVSATTFRWISK
jgi:hypothetical protein